MQMRVFISVNLSALARKELGELTQKLQKSHWPVRWEEISKIHVTLAFLGKLKNSKTLKLRAIVKKACLGINPFEVSFKGLGSFPNFIEPRVIWMGLKGDLKRQAFGLIKSHLLLMLLLAG